MLPTLETVEEGSAPPNDTLGSEQSGVWDEVGSQNLERGVNRMCFSLFALVGTILAVSYLS